MTKERTKAVLEYVEPIGARGHATESAISDAEDSPLYTAPSAAGVGGIGGSALDAAALSIGHTVIDLFLALGAPGGFHSLAIVFARQ